MTTALRNTGIEPVGETPRSEEHTSELQSRLHLVCRLLLEKKKNCNPRTYDTIARVIRLGAITAEQPLAYRIVCHCLLGSNIVVYPICVIRPHMTGSHISDI